MLQYQTIEPNTLGLLRELMTRDYLQQFILVGGTALALQIGHRKSYDLDLFSESDFDSEILLRQIRAEFNVNKIIAKVKQSLIIEIEGIKVDLIRFRYPMHSPVSSIDGIRLASIRDIAPMKLDALSARGLKRDFYDVYFLLDQISLPELISMYDKKYSHDSVFHVIRSLTYFEDAEPNPDPVLMNPRIKWEAVKQRIREEVKKLR